MAFFLVFWPAIVEGKHYGNRINHEQLAIQLNAYVPESPDDPRPLLAKAPEMLHPDYELLYQPSSRAIQSALRNGRLPLQNPHRILGTPLWGSPVADPANPLSLALLFLTPEQTHLLKLYVYFLLSFAGIFLTCTQVFECRTLPALAGACIYVLNPFMYYGYHWTALIGVVSLVPLVFYAVHTFLTKPSWWYLALIQGLIAWMLLINQIQTNTET